MKGMADHSITEMEKQESVGEQNVYTGVYRVLLAGMVASSLLFAIGIIRALLHPEFIPLTPEWVRSQYHWGTFSKGIVALEPSSVMLVATALLILTPVARVVVSIYAFAVDRDRKYVFVTGLVLAVMALTVVLGILGLQ
jgi:uncharacterized membrane protein